MNGGNDARADGRGRIYQASGDQHIIEHHHHGAERSAGEGTFGEWSGLDSVRWPSVGRAPAVLRDRTELMARLRASVAPDVGGQVYVLHGLGGCGKTAVAYTLFQYATSEANRIGLWVNASDTASLRTGMLAVAADRGAGEGELTAARSGLRAAADLVWDHLDHSDRPWLLVLDNADDPAVLRDGGWLRTSPRGTALVTTRQAARHWWPGAELLQVGVLPREDAARVLCDLAPEAGTVEEAAEVAERLGRLPLALTLAGGFLAHQVIDPWTMAQYGANLDGGQGMDPIELLDQGALTAGTGDSRHLVSSTWQFSLNALTAQGLPESVTLLRLLSCWTGDPLPLSLLSGIDMGSELSASRVEVALRGLLDQSLTELVPGKVRCLRAHGVLLDSVSRGIPADQREALAAVAGRQLLAVLPEVPQRGDNDPRTGLLAPHAIALLRRVTEWADVSRQTVEVVTDALLRLAIALHRGGDYAPALTVSTEAVELAKRRLSVDHPALLRFRERMARDLFRLGRFEESEALHREVLADCERVLGPEAPETLTCCLGLARPLYPLKRTSEAVALVRRAVTGRTKTLGLTHPLTLTARSNLLSVQPGPDLEQEVAGGADLVADCRREMGQEHEITLGVELNYAYALFSTGQVNESLPAARGALALFERRYGPEYPLTFNARTLLGRVLHALGETPEAVEHAQAVVAGRRRVLGPKHPWTLSAEQDLARFRRA
ncbi:tetratricopeptide repeat protein [Streptomyces purpurogeneiscleroticus]|uniref:tetratricopeptide repeat protein n=1 Tax=Streptomyces purpurogeneiscleroticus TaxID=68259 RepID=UPI001CC09C24|nr:tetratricopeptide repeat protein [Streptomyces purpurogeneiscleroticus]MBZ4019566.1 ATP/GTP-binding protein [Streptomyces purpurogeneiscleroticus]